MNRGIPAHDELQQNMVRGCPEATDAGRVAIDGSTVIVAGRSGSGGCEGEGSEW